MNLNDWKYFRVGDVSGYILAIISGILLSISFPDYNFFLCGWFCFVPLLIALDNRSNIQAYLIGSTTGFIALSIGFYWITSWAENAIRTPFPFSILFNLLYAFCVGQSFGLIAVLYCWIRRKLQWDEMVIFPVVFVSVLSLFPMIFEFKIGDSQSGFLSAIQPIEFTGIYGLDFIMVLSNVLLFKVVSFPLRRTGWKWMLIGGLLLLGWFSVGGIQLQRWDQEIIKWSSKPIGIVQPNREISLSRPRPEEGYSRSSPLEMEMSHILSSQGADLIIWPEGHFFGYTYWSQVKTAFSEHVRKMQKPLLFYDATYKLVKGKKRYFNTILYLNNSGELADSYDKIKLVPFSEYSPLTDKIPLLRWILGDYLDNLTPGSQTKVFKIGKMRIIPRVCYEPLFPEFVADSVGSDAAGKIILVQSQDGWFGKTSQPNQHMAATVMRAVENRVPLIHVINNGPSAVIDPAGRYLFKSGLFTKGQWVVELPFHPEKGGSFYSRFPRLFINIIRMIFVLLLVASLLMFRSPHHKT